MWTMLYGSMIGIALGLTGGGGSIFAVPILLYAVGMPLRDAVTVSLAVVGLTALYGTIIQRKLVQWMPGMILGAGGIAGAPLGAYLGARLPEFWTLLLFAALMMVIGAGMWRDQRSPEACDSRFTCRRDADGVRRLRGPCVLKLLGGGLLTGLLSGTFGVGGGFLVVPALLIVTAMPIERALATSLVCIFLISTSGFVSNLLSVQHLDFALTAWFFAGGVIGMSVGAAVKSSLSGVLLRRVFAVAVLGVSLWITVQTFLGKDPRPRRAHPAAPAHALVSQPPDDDKPLLPPA